MSVEGHSSNDEELGPLSQCMLQIGGLDDVSERRREAAAVALLDILQVCHFHEQFQVVDVNARKIMPL